MNARRLAAALLAALLWAAPPAPAPAADRLAVDLSDDEIAITTGFTGAELLLFGARDGEGDVVVVLRGPLRDTVVRRRERVAGIWVNGKSVVFREVPAYYHVAATRPLESIAPPETLAAHGIFAGTPGPVGAPGVAAAEAGRFRDGMVRNRTRQGLYGYAPGGVKVQGDRLFSTTATFPANVPIGAYRADVYLFDRGKLAAHRESALAVRKVGLEAAVFNLAHRQATLYGVAAIVIAVTAGWLAGVVFRR